MSDVCGAGGMMALGLGVLYSKFQYIMDNGHMGPPTKMTEKHD